MLIASSVNLPNEHFVNFAPLTFSPLTIGLHGRQDSVRKGLYCIWSIFMPFLVREALM